MGGGPAARAPAKFHTHTVRNMTKLAATAPPTIVATDSADIADIFAQFYEELYKADTSQGMSPCSLN